MTKSKWLGNWSSSFCNLCPKQNSAFYITHRHKTWFTPSIYSNSSIIHTNYNSDEQCISENCILELKIHMIYFTLFELSLCVSITRKPMPRVQQSVMYHPELELWSAVSHRIPDPSLNALNQEAISLDPISFLNYIYLYGERDEEGREKGRRRGRDRDREKERETETDCKHMWKKEDLVSPSPYKCPEFHSGH